MEFKGTKVRKLLSNYRDEKNRKKPRFIVENNRQYRYYSNSEHRINTTLIFLISYNILLTFGSFLFLQRMADFLFYRRIIKEKENALEIGNS